MSTPADTSRKVANLKVVLTYLQNFYSHWDEEEKRADLMFENLTVQYFEAVKRIRKFAEAAPASIADLEILCERLESGTDEFTEDDEEVVKRARALRTTWDPEFFDVALALENSKEDLSNYRWKKGEENQTQNDSE
jgi:hypothetical protein